MLVFRSSNESIRWAQSHNAYKEPKVNERIEMTSAAKRQLSGKTWEDQTLGTLSRIFPDDIILFQVTTPEVPHARPDFAVVNAGLIVECKAYGLTPVQEKVLAEHKRREERFASIGMTYVWWVDRERDELIDRTRRYLQNVFYNCKGEMPDFIRFLEDFKRAKT
jgi:hypothetical protein